MPFSTIVGHRRIRALLGRAAAHNTVPPALLFAGPRGVGKRRMAQALAETLNCTAPLTTDAGLDACGACVACRRIARGIHPDVIVLEPGESGSIKTDQVREVIDRAAYRPFEGRRRVVIVDDADAMGAPAQSALLKTLEEPPSASVFVLVSSMPDALLGTVRSRCPRLRFAPLSPAEVAEVLVRDHRYADADARAVAVDADGSVGQALEASSTQVTGARDAALQLLSQVARIGDPSGRMELAKALAGGKGSPGADRQDLTTCLRALASLLRDVGVLVNQGDHRLLAHSDLEPMLSGLASRWDGNGSVRAFDAVDRAIAALERNASPKVVADWLVLQL